MNSRKIFLSWGGEEARLIADWLRTNIFDQIPGFEPAFMSPLIRQGDLFRNAIHRELNLATDGIGIMTDVALTRPWFLYELAYLRGRLPEVPMLRYCQRPPENNPLSDVQDRDGFKFESIVALTEQLTSSLDSQTRRLVVDATESKAAAWQTFVRPLQIEFTTSSVLRNAISSAIAAITEPHLVKEIGSHSCMRELASKTLDDMVVTFQQYLQSTPKSFLVASRRYPEYLMHLQSSLHATTCAIAVVEDVEEFWAQKTGSGVLKSTSEESQRVFLFANRAVFDQYISQVMLHADNYRVFVMSVASLGKIGHRIKADFSVITDPRTKQVVTAFYDNSAAYVQFTADSNAIQRNLMVFEEVLKRAHRVEPPGNDAERKTYAGELANLIFATRTDETTYYHSDVVPIHLYDAHEEDHPYYRAMRDKILTELRTRVDSREDAFRVLEIGAGTGHLTKRLAQQPFPSMIIRAVEPDPKAQEILDRKMKHKSWMFRSLGASILSYDPRGEFKFVLSSFSDHHIPTEAKARYFSTVSGNMEKGGLFIVGDEFLPPYDWKSAKEYDAALERYHLFIIDEAETENLWEVAHLERLALESGRHGASNRIDYKIDLETYKQIADSSGLVLESQHCITPPEQALEIGGIYVLVFSKP